MFQTKPSPKSVEPPVDRQVLRNTQRKLKMDAVLASNRNGLDQLCTPSPQRKSMLSRTSSQNIPTGKENVSRTSRTSKTPGSTPPKRTFSSRPSSVEGAPVPSTTKLPGPGPDSRQEILRYTSLSELVISIPKSPSNGSDIFSLNSPAAAPRTPMKDALVEKAVQAYLQPSESFLARNQRSGWGTCLVLRQFLPSFLTDISSKIPNPIQLFYYALQALSLYLTKNVVSPETFLLRDNQSDSRRHGTS